MDVKATRKSRGFSNAISNFTALLNVYEPTEIWNINDMRFVAQQVIQATRTEAKLTAEYICRDGRMLEVYRENHPLEGISYIIKVMEKDNG